MPLRDRAILRAAAVWTVVIWAVFVKNVVGDAHRSTGFKVVHVCLAIVSVLFAFAIWAVASRSRSRQRAASRD